MDVRTEDQGKNGTKNLRQRLTRKPSANNLPIRDRRVRKYHSINGMAAAAGYATPLPVAREVSVSDLFRSLAITAGQPVNDNAQKQQSPVVLPPETPTKVPANVTMRNRSRGGDKLGPCPEKFGGSLVAPRSPSAKELKRQVARLDSSYKATKEAFLTPSPTKPQFLTKETNTRGFVAWDVDERLGNFESEFKAMKEMINNSISGQKSLEDDVAAVRSKGRRPIGVPVLRRED
jgi:hypothetical protein